MTPVIDLAGKVFTRLTVIGRAGSSKWQQALWLTRCECGRTRVVKSEYLRNGEVRSCGCLRDELAITRKTTHGLCYTREYQCWHRMMQRCYNPKTTGYKYWGGRGISVCARWHSFTNFYADMGPRPSPQHSIDRIDNEFGIYEPGNVRWATSSEQNKNRRKFKRNRRPAHEKTKPACVDSERGFRHNQPKRNEVNRTNRAGGLRDFSTVSTEGD